MDHLDDSENNAKISDSAYSNSCSNSQSRRSHSSKSTHSGSNSSGSSGYGGKPSTSGSSNNLGQPPKKETDSKKKKLPQIETIVADVIVETEVRAPEPVPTFDAPAKEELEVIPAPPSVHAQSEKGVENMELCTSELNSLKDEVVACNLPVVSVATNFVANRALPAAFCMVPPERYQEIGRYEMRCENTENMLCQDGFSCVISMHDGVVMYTTTSLTTALGFPKDMWIGRSFIDFVHPRDRSTFASQITNGLAVPKNVNNGTVETAQSPVNSVSTMVCRIRRYRSLTTGFGVKDKNVSFMPFLLKLTFKNISDEEGKMIYLVIQATPFFSAFKTPNEVVIKAVPFVMRHASNGHIEYVDPESVPYLGYLPQDLADKEALQLYHPEDLHYLHQVYDTIVKEGGLPRSKPYRMLTQNGDYLRLETEWSSFINPWSKKLEFVIGKHHIIEGPMNPDVFQLPEPEKGKVNEEERNKIQKLREAIIRTLNEVLTKPAEVAKQQMSKRCQDLASFMESLMEEVPKTDDELRLEIQDADHSYYERDSVMLGGISPHHDYFANDSKSSTETPLSYNQLNYNETLQRYFDSHQPISFEDYNTVTGENILGLKDPRPLTNHCLSPMAQHSRDSGDMTCSSDSNGMICLNSPLAPIGDYHPIRLTESLLSKHNSEMEKELLKIHRESRSSSKGEREKNSNETRQKKKEHLARCNASYHPTSAGVTSTAMPGTKRASKHLDVESGTHKHHCPSPRSTRRKPRQLSTSAPAPHPPVSKAVTTAMETNHWSTAPVNNMNSFVMGVPQQMSIMSPMAAMPGMPGMAHMPGMTHMPGMAHMPGMTHMAGMAPMPGMAHMPGMATMPAMQAMQAMPAMPGMFPMYYAPAAPQPMPSTSAGNPPQAHHFQAPAMMMYGQPMYASPFMYSPINPQFAYPMQQTHMMAQSMQYSNNTNPLGLTSSNYEEACKPSLSLRPGNLPSVWRDRIRAESHKFDRGSGNITNALNRESEANDSNDAGNEKSTKYSTDIRSSSNSNSLKSTEAVPNTPPLSRVNKLNTRLGHTEETPDKTDGESSYSSFYSSFFKTESGSAEESGGDKANKDKRFRSPLNSSSAYYQPNPVKRVARRKMEPPWMEQVCVTSELIYKYQVLTKNMEEVLSADKQKMETLEQPSLVNEQLGQLYLDLQLEGVAARLTLEEGITSSSSSGEETTTTKKSRRKREYSKLVMIYEEDAPMPPPDAEVEAEGSSTSTF